MNDEKYLTERRHEDIKLAGFNNPCATLQSIADKYDLSRERVRQILVKAGSPTKSVRPKRFCSECGEQLKQYQKYYCGFGCYHKSTVVEVACKECGTLKEYSIKEILWRREHGLGKDHFFCSNKCQGKWLAKTHGFAVHPENRKYRRKRE